MEHTKEPWKQGLDFFGKPCNRIEDAEGNPIAYADWHPDGIRDWGKTIANARLIAEAPAMLRRLESAARWVGKLAADNDTNYIGERAHQELERINAVIAKARGE